MVKPSQYIILLNTFILKVLPLQTEHNFFFNLYTMKAKTRSTIMETANATIRQNTRRGGTLVELPNTQSRYTITQISLMVISNLFRVEKYADCITYLQSPPWLHSQTQSPHRRPEHSSTSLHQEGSQILKQGLECSFSCEALHWRGLYTVPHWDT